MEDKGKKLKKIFAILVSAMVLAVAVTACANKEAPKTKEAAKTAEKEADQQGEGVQHKVLAFNLEGLSDKGEKRWEVKGKSAESVSAEEVKLDDIVAKSYGDGTEATITADKGTYNKSKNNVILEKSVKADIESSKSGLGEIGITGMMGQAKDNENKNTGSDNPKKTKTTITCDGEAQFDYGKNAAFFNKNVKVVSDDGTINAELITVNFDPKTKKVINITAEGDVKIAKDENVTYSNKATYLESEKRIVLSGQPKIVIYQEGDVKDNFLGK